MKFKFELNDDGDLRIKHDNGETDIVITEGHLDDLINFIRSDKVKLIKVHKCTVDGEVWPNCVYDTGSLHDCDYAEKLSCREECQYWKEVNTYEIKE